MGERAKWVLVIDDDEGVCAATVDMLEDAGYLAMAAPGGVAALRVIAAGAPSLVLSDLTMGGMDGQKLLKCTRELLATASPPFVFLTGLERTAGTDEPRSLVAPPVLERAEYEEARVAPTADA